MIRRLRLKQKGMSTAKRQACRRKEDNQLVDVSRLEEMRLAVAMAMVATMVGLYSVSDPVGWILALRPLMIVPGLSSLLYLILFASHLKYKKADIIGDLDIPRSLRAGAYDFAIDNFWFTFLVVVIFIIAKILGWNGDSTDVSGLLKGAVVAFPVISLLMAALYYWRQKEEKGRRG